MVTPEYDSHANFLCRSIYHNKKIRKNYKSTIVVNSKSSFLACGCRIQVPLRLIVKEIFSSCLWPAYDTVSSAYEPGYDSRSYASPDSPSSAVFSSKCFAEPSISKNSTGIE